MSFGLQFRLMGKNLTYLMTLIHQMNRKMLILSNRSTKIKSSISEIFQLNVSSKFFEMHYLYIILLYAFQIVACKVVFLNSSNEPKKVNRSNSSTMIKSSISEIFQHNVSRKFF